MRIGHKNNNILKIAIEYGCKTAKDLAYIAIHRG